MDNKTEEKIGHNPNNLWNWKDLIEFQLDIAERWFHRGNETEDIFAKFLFYYTGFNAIYYLWRKLDDLGQVEWKHIENLLNKFNEAKAHELLDKVRIAVDYFIQHDPIQRMDVRNLRNQNIGNKSEGRKWKIKLQDNNLSKLERLNALGQILYIVRCNLVHGSKKESGDDLKIIKMSIEPLKLFLTETLFWSKQQCPWET